MITTTGGRYGGNNYDESLMYKRSFVYPLLMVYIYPFDLLGGRFDCPSWKLAIE